MTKDGGYCIWWLPAVLHDNIGEVSLKMLTDMSMTAGLAKERNHGEIVLQVFSNLCRFLVVLGSISRWISGSYF